MGLRHPAYNVAYWLSIKTFISEGKAGGQAEKRRNSQKSSVQSSYIYSANSSDSSVREQREVKPRNAEILKSHLYSHLTCIQLTLDQFHQWGNVGRSSRETQKFLKSLPWSHFTAYFLQWSDFWDILNQWGEGGCWRRGTQRVYQRGGLNGWYHKCVISNAKCLICKRCVKRVVSNVWWQMRNVLYEMWNLAYPYEVCEMCASVCTTYIWVCALVCATYIWVCALVCATYT